MPFTFPRVIRVGHVVVTVADLAASRHFYVDLLGFNVVHDTDRALYLRGVEDREWSLKLELGAEPGVRQLAYKAGSEAALDEIAAMIRDGFNLDSLGATTIKQYLQKKRKIPSPARTVRNNEQKK